MLDPDLPVGRFLREALRYPDGIVAYAMAALPIFLLAAAWMVLPFFPEVALLRRAREDWLFLLVLPVLALVMYARLNAFYEGTPARRWINVAMLLFLAVVSFWRVVVG